VDDTLSPRENLTPEQRFVFDHLRQETFNEAVEDAHALVERYPDDPLYRAHYARLLLGATPEEERVGKKMDELIAAFDAGERVDPDNAFFDHMKASLLFQKSSKLLEDKGVRYEIIEPRDGEILEKRGDRIKIQDEQMFRRAVAEAREGAHKPRWESYAKESFERKLDLARPPRTLAGQLRVIGAGAAILMPGLQSMRAVSRRLPAYALHLAEQGRREEAADVLGWMYRPGVQIGANADFIIELLIGRACAGIALGQAPVIYEKLEMEEKAEPARRRKEQSEQAWRLVWQAYDEEKSEEWVYRRGGMLVAMLAPAGVDYRDTPLVPAARRAEHIVTQQGALAALTAVLMALTLALGAVNCWNLWRYRRTARGPKLFFVGWERLGMILLLGLALPVAAYWVYTRLAGFSSMRFGMNYIYGRVALELALVLCTVLLAVLCLAYRAVRRRCAEAGMEVPGGTIFNPLRSPFAAPALAGVAGAAAYYFVFWRAESMRTVLGLLGAIGLCALAFIYIIWQFRRLWREAPPHFGRTCVRSLMPVLAACLVLVGLTSRLYLRSSETEQIRRMNTPGSRLYFDELQMSHMSTYRDLMREWNRQWQLKEADAAARRSGILVGMREPAHPALPVSLPTRRTPGLLSLQKRALCHSCGRGFNDP
jgi:hypothetical protein